jgi:hypothetical protein
MLPVTPLNSELANFFFKLYPQSRAPVAHVCNPSYSGGRDQEVHSLKPVWANSLRPYLKNTHYRKGLVEWLTV